VLPAQVEARNAAFALRSARLVDGKPVRPRIDCKQRIALLDDLAILELDGIDEAETRARTSTVAVATNRPVYSSIRDLPAAAARL
jgi:hypothetical protein